MVRTNLDPGGGGGGGNAGTALRPDFRPGSGLVVGFLRQMESWVRPVGEFRRAGVGVSPVSSSGAGVGGPTPGFAWSSIVAGILHAFSVLLSGDWDDGQRRPNSRLAANRVNRSDLHGAAAGGKDLRKTATRPGRSQSHADNSAKASHAATRAGSQRAGCARRQAGANELNRAQRNLPITGGSTRNEWDRNGRGRCCLVFVVSVPR